MKQNTKKDIEGRKQIQRIMKAFPPPTFLILWFEKPFPCLFLCGFFFPVSSFTSLYSLAFLSTCNDRVLYFISNEEKQTPQERKSNKTKNKAHEATAKNK